MPRTLWTVSAAVALLVGSLVAPTPVAAAELAVTVTPATDLVDGQTVAVSVTGAEPGGFVQAELCADTADANRSCAFGAGAYADAGADGTAHFDIVVEAEFRTFDGRTVDCRVAPGCALVVAVFGEGELTPSGDRHLDFRPDGPLRPPPVLTVTPADDLVDGSIVRVEGSGYLPSSFVTVVQCRAPFATYEDCDARQIGDQAGPDGSVTMEYDTATIIRVGSGQVDCRATACELVATRSLFVAEPRHTARVALTFRPDGPLLPPPVLTVEPSDGIGDGRELTVTGSGFRVGGVAIAQCSGTGEVYLRCSNDWQSVEVDASRTLTTTVTARVLLRTESGYRDCRSVECTIAAIDWNGGNVPLAEVPLVFDPGGPEPQFPELQLGPAGPLASRSGVIVQGGGYRPGSSVSVRQCRLDAGLPNDCEQQSGSYADVGPDGTFVAGTLVTALFAGADGADVDCRAVECVLVADGFGVPYPGMARLDFGTASDRARRYLAGVFDDVEVRDGLVYRTTTNSRGQTVDLKLDVYEPAGDRASLRPAIVWMFGGYFASGDRAQLADMARGMARRGYVSVAIDYRTRPEIFDTSHGCVPVGGTCLDPTQLEPAIRDARDDARAAMVWLHEHAAELRIEPRAISAAGWSAGAITALNLAHDSTGDRDPASVPAAAVSLAGIVAAAPGAADPPTLMLGGNRDSLLSLDAQVAGCASIGTAGASCEFVAYAGVQPAPAEDPCVRYSVSCTYELGRDGDHGFFFSERPGVLDHISAFVAREVLRPVGLLDHRRRHHHEHGHHHHHDDGHHHRHHRHDEGHGHG